MTGLQVSDVDLSGARIENGDLTGLEIADCRLTGARINGVLIEDLLDAYRTLQQGKS
jgi:uncharacterized protein YjbI with pentapeptide repeats